MGISILQIVNVLADEKNPSAQPFVSDQINSLENIGIDITIFNIRGNESIFNYLKAVIKVYKLIKSNKFDLVHCHYVYSGWVGVLTRKTPVIVSFMGSDLLGSPNNKNGLQLRGYLDIWLSRILQFFVDGIIVKSKRMQNALLLKSKSIVLPNGVDFEKFHYIPQQKARELIGIDPSKKYVLFAGSYNIPRKCYWVIEKAIEILKSRDMNIDILLAYGLPHDKIPLYMNAANILALASIHEGSPNVIKEAMACCLPIVSTDVGDVQEIINGVEGCRIVDRDPLAFADAIQEILESVNRTNGRQQIAHLSLENIAQQLFKFYLKETNIMGH